MDSAILTGGSTTTLTQVEQAHQRKGRVDERYKKREGYKLQLLCVFEVVYVAGLARLVWLFAFLIQHQDSCVLARLGGFCVPEHLSIRGKQTRGRGEP